MQSRCGAGVVAVALSSIVAIVSFCAPCIPVYVPSLYLRQIRKDEVKDIKLPTSLHRLPSCLAASVKTKAHGRGMEEGDQVFCSSVMHHKSLEAQQMKTATKKQQKFFLQTLKFFFF